MSKVKYLYDNYSSSELLNSFLMHEVIFRLEEFFDVDDKFIEANYQGIADLLLDNSDIIFDYDNIDSFIREEIDSINNQVDSINNQIDILLGALVFGVDFRVRYEMIAPYTHGYSISYRGSEIMTTSSWPFSDEVLVKLWKKVSEIEGFSYKTLLKKLKEVVGENQKDHPSIDICIASGYELASKYQYKEILEGKYSGTYSTMTPNSQNKLAMQLIRLRGHAGQEGLKGDEERNIVERINAICQLK